MNDLIQANNYTEFKEKIECYLKKISDHRSIIELCLKCIPNVDNSGYNHGSKSEGDNIKISFDCSISVKIRDLQSSKSSFNEEHDEEKYNEKEYNEVHGDINKEIIEKLTPENREIAREYEKLDFPYTVTQYEK